MIYLLSPAKSLDYETPLPVGVASLASQPQFMPQAAALIKLLKPMKSDDIGALMDLSAQLATLNLARYKTWSRESTAANSRPALLAFNGDVYDGLQAASLVLPDLQWAQSHLAILSGLYGILRPLDLLQPYRLEMGTRLANPLGANLYNFWGDRLARQLDLLAKASQSNVIVNLASQEYFRAVDRPCLKTPVIECVFEDWKTDRYKIISFFAKRARGLMARYAITNRIDDPQALTGFDLDGYKYTGELSTPSRLLFRRRQD